MRHSKPVRLQTAPTGPDRSPIHRDRPGSKSRGESVHLFFEFTIKTDPFEQPLRDEIEKLAARYPTYGYRRITPLLRRLGYDVCTTRVAPTIDGPN